MRLRTIYFWVSLPLVVWLLVSNLDLRYYRRASLAHDVNGVTSGLPGSRQDLNRAMETLDQKLDNAAIEWMATAEKELVRVQAGAQGYNAALNNPFSRTHGNFLELDPIVGMYGQEIRSVRQYLEYNGELRAEDRAMLVDIASDLLMLQEALPEDLLRRARRSEIQGQVRSLGKSLKVQSVRSWLGA